MTIPVNKIAAIYDIHGNLPALEAVLAEIEREGVDLVVVGGDVAAGPMPRETIDRLRSLGGRAVYVCGNADRLMVAGYDQLAAGGVIPEPVEWAATQMRSSDREFLASFPENVVVEIAGIGTVRFCHGSPRSDEEILTSRTSDDRLGAILQDVAEPVVVCGHTHIQFDRRFGRWRVLNAGSVGMPYELPHGARWLLLGPDIQHRVTAFDVDAAATVLAQSSYPEIEEWTDAYLRNPSAADEASAFFEELAIARDAEKLPERA